MLHFNHQRQIELGKTQCTRCKSWFKMLKRHKCRSAKCISCDEQVPNLKLHIERYHKNLKHIKETKIFPDTIAAIISGYSPNPKMVSMCTGCGLKMQKYSYSHLHGCPHKYKRILIDSNDQIMYRRIRLQQLRQLEPITY